MSYYFELEQELYKHIPILVELSGLPMTCIALIGELVVGSWFMKRALNVDGEIKVGKVSMMKGMN